MGKGLIGNVQGPKGYHKCSSERNFPVHQSCQKEAQKRCHNSEEPGSTAPERKAIEKNYRHIKPRTQAAKGNDHKPADSTTIAMILLLRSLQISKQIG